MIRKAKTFIVLAVSILSWYMYTCIIDGYIFDKHIMICMLILSATYLYLIYYTLFDLAFHLNVRRNLYALISTSCGLLSMSTFVVLQQNLMYYVNSDINIVLALISLPASICQIIFFFLYRRHDKRNSD